ncbi:lytic transglycosylase-like protein [Nocardia nova SH22a]|uniref:Lytic transglycosylase-like protein n=2 Tax=Nocardia nova TaxID=37330 RepID=W5T9Y6_9NOCA|nr:lytic transglycosylase-like protein [Nocardia nova SH22a]
MICAMCVTAASVTLAAPAQAQCGSACADASGSASGSATGSMASGSAGAILGLPARAVALTIVPLPQFPAFDSVISHESSWNPYAVNPKSGAYGLGQALPPEKMAAAGPDWLVNPVTQIRWAYDYMIERYGGPDGAWAFWQSHGWY